MNNLTIRLETEKGYRAAEERQGETGTGSLSCFVMEPQC